MKKRDLAHVIRDLATIVPGSAAHQNVLLLRPLTHTIRGVLLDTSIDPTGFYAHVFLQPLFVPSLHFVLSLGWRLGGGTHLWRTDPVSLSDLRTQVLDQALPFLVPVRSARDLVNTIEILGRDKDPYRNECLAYALAFSGQSDQALESLRALMLSLNTEIEWQREMTERASRVFQLLQTDPPGAQRLLAAWSSETAHNLSISALVET